MAAIRLLNTEGLVIGTVILDKKELEDEIVNALPELRLTYSATPTDIFSFTLETIPPSDVVVWDPESKRMVPRG